MKKVLIAAALLFAALPFTANAGFFGKDEWEKEDCPKNHSLAWCLTDYHARSKGIRDMSQEEFIETLKKAGVDESHIGDILGSSLGVGAGLGNLALGNLLGGGVFLLHALMPDAVEQNRRDPYIVFFDEGDPNRTDEQVTEISSSIFHDAINKALPVLPSNAKVTVAKSGVLIIEMPGYECKGNLSCMIGNSPPGFKVEKKSTPGYMGGKQVISPTRGSTVGISMYDLPKGLNAAVFVKAISENLPPNMYWFIPAGYLGGNPVPIVMNQGNAMFFVKPSPSDTVTVLPHIASRFKADDKPVVQSAPESPSAPTVMQTSSLAH